MTSPPESRRAPVTDRFHGVEVVEDYRWLESWESREVKTWTDEQNVYARAHLDALPGRDAIEARLTEIMAAPQESTWAVTPAGERFIALRDQPPKQQPFLVVFDSLDEAGLDAARVLVDPEIIDPDGGTSMDWFRPSPDGTLVAVSLSEDGTEAGDLHFFDVETGEQVHEIVPRVNTGTAGGDLAWAPDSRGVYYTRHPREGERPPEDLNFYQQAYFHRLGTSPDEDRYELGRDFPRIAEIEFEVHEATGQVLLTVQDGDGGEFAHYLKAPEGDWRPFSEFGDKTVQATFAHDGKSLVVLNRHDAPRGQLLRLRVDALPLSKATTLVPQGEDTIVSSFYGRPPSLLPTRDRIYVLYQLGGPSEIRVFDLEGNRLDGPKQFPVGRAGGLTRLNPDGDEILFSQGSFTEPTGIFRFDPATGATSATAAGSRPPVDFEGVTVRREMATSRDGTQVPVNLLFPPGYDPENPAPLPAHLTGYGGYGISLQPGFSSKRKVALEQGTILAIANLRGGGEFGEAWHRDGNLTKKQNVFDDFSAVLTHLVERGYTTPDRLAIEGGSNGGLLMGATLTQHPEQVACVISHVGIYDMLRFELSPNGSFNIPEFGTVKDEAQFRALHAYSPYHRVSDGVAYPPLLLLHGANDPRVDAMQSRKMAARLQRAIDSGKGGPILLRTSLDSGHGAGTALDEQIAQQVDVHAFLFRHLGIDYRASD